MTKTVSTSLSLRDYHALVAFLARVPFANLHQVSLCALRYGVRRFQEDPHVFLTELSSYREERRARQTD